MRRILLLVGLILLCLGTMEPLRAQTGDPSELFLNAYMAVQQGERLEHDGTPKQALMKYQSAASLLEQLQQKYPSWQPLIVEYRKKRTTENIARIEEQIGVQPSATPPRATADTEAPLPNKEPQLEPPPRETGAPAQSAGTENADDMRSRVTQLQNELRESKAQLRAAQKEKEQIAGQLDDALREIDKSKTSIAELKSKLQQVQDAFKNVAAGGAQDAGARKALQKQISQLQDQLADAQADREAADAVNSDYARRMTKVRKTAADVIQERAAATAKLKEIEAKYADASKMAKQLEEAQAKIANLTEENQASHQSDDEIAKKLAETQKQLATIAKDRDAARKQADDLNKKVSDAQKQIVAAGAERDKIAKERDAALAELAKAKDAQKRIDQLIADNASLAQKLGDSEKMIKGFNASAPEKDQQIANLRKEVGETKELLAATKKQNEEYQSSMAALQSQLDTDNKELAEMQASGATAAEKKKFAEENDLLRGIVLRQLKEQARREQSKKLVLAELQRLKVQSSTLMQQIDYLGQPVVKLTDKERALFKQPQIEIPEAETPAMEFSVAAPKPEASSTPAASPQEMAKLTNPAASPAPTAAGENAKPEGSLPTKEASPTEGGAATPGAPNLPTDLMADAHNAKDQFDRGEYRDAEKTYERMLTKAPNNVYILSNLGVVEFRQNKMKLAEEKFKKAIAVAPEDAFSQRTLGIVYYQQGKYDDAVSSLTKAIAIAPKDAISHNYLGIAASQKGWQEAALKELETAIALDPNYADANFNLAVIYATMQPPNKEAAQKYYRRATSLGAEPDTALEQLIK